MGRPTTIQSAPSATACAGVATRAWSPASLPAGRMPGTTSRGPSPSASRSSDTSRGEQTRPSAPASIAIRARRSTCWAGPPATPVAPSAAASMLVSTVTASRIGRWDVPPGVRSAASRAAAIMAGLPQACRDSMAAPSGASDRTAPATVFGMSCSLRSRKTGRCVASRASMGGPSAQNSSRPSFASPECGATASPSARARAASGVSSATIRRSRATWGRASISAAWRPARRAGRCRPPSAARHSRRATGGGGAARAPPRR